MEHEMLKQEREIAELTGRVSANEENIKTLYAQQKEQKKLLDAVQELALSLRDVMHGQQSLNRKVDSMAKDIDELKAEPAEKWKYYTREAAKVVLAACVGFLLSRIGVG